MFLSAPSIEVVENLSANIWHLADSKLRSSPPKALRPGANNQTGDHERARQLRRHNRHACTIGFMVNLWSDGFKRTSGNTTNQMNQPQEVSARPAARYRCNAGTRQT